MQHCKWQGDTLRPNQETRNWYSHSPSSLGDGSLASFLDFWPSYAEWCFPESMSSPLFESESRPKCTVGDSTSPFPFSLSFVGWGKGFALSEKPFSTGSLSSPRLLLGPLSHWLVTCFQLLFHLHWVQQFDLFFFDSTWLSVHLSPTFSSASSGSFLDLCSSSLIQSFQLLSDFSESPELLWSTGI